MILLPGMIQTVVLRTFLIGGGVGAVLGGGAYMVQVWMTAEQFSWAKFGICTLAGGASGALTAATFGAASAYLGTGLAADFLAGGTAGGGGGITHGLIASGGNTWLETGSFSQALIAGLRRRRSKVRWGLLVAAWWRSPWAVIPRPGS